jgi:hypothetical protein
MAWAPLPLAGLGGATQTQAGAWLMEHRIFLKNPSRNRLRTLDPVAATPIGPEVAVIEDLANLKLNTSFNITGFPGSSRSYSGYWPHIIGHDQVDGSLKVWSIDPDLEVYTRNPTVIGTIGKDWKLQIVPEGSAAIYFGGIFGHNQETRQLRFWNPLYDRHGFFSGLEQAPDLDTHFIGTEWDLQLGLFGQDREANGPDILGRHATTGEIVVWRTNGRWKSGELVLASEAVPFGQIGVEWRVQVRYIDAVADRQGDLFGHSTKGDLRRWLNVEGRHFDGGAALGPPGANIGAEWQLYHSYLSDGRKFLIGRSNTGALHTWFLDGDTITSERSLGSISGYFLQGLGTIFR